MGKNEDTKIQKLYRICISCPNGCEECNANGFENITCIKNISCRSSEVMLKGVCLATCPDNFYNISGICENICQMREHKTYNKLCVLKCPEQILIMMEFVFKIVQKNFSPIIRNVFLLAH